LGRELALDVKRCRRPCMLPYGHLSPLVLPSLSCLPLHTSLLPTTYAMQASAAADLGGIEAARRRHVVTLGLDTLAFNRRAVVVILAAGEQKARAVADAVTCPRSARISASWHFQSIVFVYHPGCLACCRAVSPRRVRAAEKEEE